MHVKETLTGICLVWLEKGDLCCVPLLGGCERLLGNIWDPCEGPTESERKIYSLDEYLDKILPKENEKDQKIVKDKILRIISKLLS